MLDARITIIDGKMTKFDRSNKVVSFVDHQNNPKSLNYDILVMTLGLLDKTADDIKNPKKKKFKDSKEISLTNFKSAPRSQPCLLNR